MADTLKPRHSLILGVMRDMGGEGSTREIAEAATLDVNGTSQSLGALASKGVVEGIRGSGRAGDYRWRLLEFSTARSVGEAGADQPVSNEPGEALDNMTLFD